MATSFKNILVVTATWLLLYFIAIYGVQLSFKLAENQYWATPLWVLVYLLPGYIGGYLMPKKWILLGILISVLGSLFWVKHAQISNYNLGVFTSIASNILVCLFGAWLGRTKRNKNNAL